MNILSELKDRFRGVLGPLTDDVPAALDLIRPAQDPKFGDYQANCAMPIGKRLGQAPRDVAQQLVDGLTVGDLCEPPEIAGPGFINLRLQDNWLSQQVTALEGDPRMGVRGRTPGRRVAAAGRRVDGCVFQSDH